MCIRDRANHALFVFEVMVPDAVDIGRLRRELSCEGQSRDLRVSVQHRDIFEDVYKRQERAFLSAGTGRFGGRFQYCFKSKIF